MGDNLGGLMFVIGEVRDSKLAQRIVETIQKEGVQVEHRYSDEKGVHLIAIHSREDIEKSYEIYCVMTGRGLPPKRDLEIEKILNTPRGPVTNALLILSLFTFALITLPLFNDSSQVILNTLMFDDQTDVFFQRLSQGEVWRLITPIFLHFGFIHLLFNMMWLKDLGKIYEYQMGFSSLLLFILGCSLLSNIGQYLVQGPYFGGMSGVVFGLLGHLWMFKRFNPQSHFSLPKFDIYLMVGWLFLCLTGLVGNVANTAHALGLSFGMLWGIWQSYLPNNSKDLEGVSFEHCKYTFLAFFFSIAVISYEVWRNHGLFFELN